MSIYIKLDPVPEYRTEFAFKSKREYIAKANIPNLDNPNQHIDVEIPHGSRDHAIVPDTVKIKFYLDIESTDKMRTIVDNFGKALVKKKMLILSSNQSDTINDSDIYDTCKNLYLREKEREENLPECMQSANGLKALVGANKVDGTKIQASIKENTTKTIFDERLAIPSHFDSFEHLVYLYELTEELILRLKLNPSGNLILCV